MPVFGDEPCPLALRVGLGFHVSLQVKYTCGSHGQDSCSICPLSVLPTDRAIGRIDTGNNMLLRPRNLEMTLQKEVLSQASPRELSFIFF